MKEDVTSEGTGVVEDVHTTKVRAELLEADAMDTREVVPQPCEVGNSDPDTVTQTVVSVRVASTLDGNMGQSMNLSDKRVIEFFRDQLRIRNELVEQTGAHQRIIGDVTGSKESNALSRQQPSELWMEIATAKAEHLATGKHSTNPEMKHV
jgi:hypothetical protein